MPARPHPKYYTLRQDVSRRIQNIYTDVQNFTRAWPFFYTLPVEFFGLQSKCDPSVSIFLHGLGHFFTNSPFTFIFPLSISNPCWRKNRSTYSEVSKWNFWSCISIKNLLFRMVLKKLFPNSLKSAPRREKKCISIFWIFYTKVFSKDTGNEIFTRMTKYLHAMCQNITHSLLSFSASYQNTGTPSFKILHVASGRFAEDPKYLHTMCQNITRCLRTSRT